jgi:hypothetical protein
VARRVMVLLALGALALVACQPVKKTPPAPTPGPVPGRSIAYYFVEDFDLTPPTDAFRSPTPFTQPINGGLGRASQTLNSDGTVDLVTSNASDFGAFTGFYTHLFRLGDLVNASVRLAPGSSPVGLALVIDQSGNGEWGEWDANGMRTGFGGDDTGFGPLTAGGYVEINDNRRFFLETGNDWLLSELKAGAEVGIDADTRVALLIVAFSEHFFFQEDANTLVTSLVMNGVELIP